MQPFTSSSKAPSSSSSWSPHPHVLPSLPPSSSSSSSSPTFVLSSPDLPTKALAAIREGRYKDVGDFDDHLEDIGADWLENREVMIGLVKKEV